VLELLEGKNLFEVLKDRKGKFSLNEVRVIMQGLLRGLRCMLDNNIMHRDLKPENIMFRSSSFTTLESYEPVIVDFGLAANSELVPYLFFRCGTPGFVAPEIIKTQQNEKYYPACDMFSVGCIFHLLMTNHAIFQGSKYEDVYRRNKLLEFSIKKQLISSFHPSALDLL
jgi:calcium-dependent protein kinase